MSGRRRLALLLALLLPPSAAVADDEAALYFLGRARDAIAAGDLDRASEFLEKSAKEKEAYPPTLLAIADVANRRGDRETAIRFLDACLEQGKRADLSVSEREAVAEAEKMLAALDEARAQFRKLVAEHVEDLVRLARSTKDATLARECWRAVAKLDPEHEEARERLAGRDAPASAAPKPAARPKGKPLFDGKKLDGLNAQPPEWTVDGGILTGRLADGGILARTDRTIPGTFTLTCEMRTKEDLGKHPALAILIGIKGTYDHYGLWICDDNMRVQNTYAEGKGSDLQRCGLERVSEKFDRKEWHVYRVEVEGKRIRCSVDGREVLESAAATRELSGPIGILVQEQEAEIRWIVLEQGK
jgi:tetratricopeptide (TPR) repeat protein